MKDVYKWWHFTVYVPPSGQGGDDDLGYEYGESEQGTTLEDAKETFRKENPDVIVLAGGEAEDD